MLLRGVLLFTLLCVIREALTQSMQGVAPGDEEQLCQELRMTGIAPTPNYDPNMAILMDSNNYQNLLPNRTGAVWQQVDNDVNNNPTITTNWIQQSNSPCNQAVLVCGFTAGPQDNRLITQPINRTVDGLRLPRVSVLIEFEQQDCDITLNCQRTFNTHVYETSSVDSAAARDVNNYRQVRRVSPSVTDGSRVNETVDIDFTTDRSSFYFSIEDETSCIVVTRVIVFYTICPKQAVDMISYPQTTAPTSGLTTISTVCVENAEPVGAQPKVACSSDGSWDALVSQCRCLPGAFNVSGACILCLAGTYLSPSNGNCSQCPANSFSDRDGLAECTCDPGHYRASGEEDLPCRRPPPPPTNVQVVDTTEHTITVTWNPPANYISANITYDVYIVRIDRNQQEQTRLRVYRGPNTVFTIQNLDPGARYNVSVSTFSDLTDQILAAGDIDVIAVSQPITVPGGPADNTVIVAVVVALVVIVIVVVITVLVILFLIWVYRKSQDDGGKQLISQYHEAAELAERTGRQMYVDPSIYASPDEAIREHTSEIPPKHLSVKEEIGRGEFGAVYKGTWKNAGKQTPIAIKTLKPHSTAKQRNDFLSEASIMGQFNHPNVVKLYGVVTKVEPVMIIMEFLENGSLFHYLRANDEKLGLTRLLKMAKGVATGMDYLSAIGFVHRDLAARNVLVSKNETCKVADFGLSRETVDEIYKVNKGGKIPVRWTAPEAIYKRKFTHSSDVWSFGVLFWEVMSYGQNPYDDMDNQELLDKLDDGYRLERPDKTPDEVYQLMLECWDDDNIKRPTFAMIAQRLEELLQQSGSNNNSKPPVAKKPSKTYTYTSQVAISPLDYQTVGEWLDGLKMGQYKTNFESRGISTTNEVLALDDEALKKMNIAVKGHISKIARSIALGNQKLGREPSMRI